MNAERHRSPQHATLHYLMASTFWHVQNASVQFIYCACTGLFLISHHPCIHSFIHSRRKSVRSRCDGSSDRSFMVNPLIYFSFQPVLHDWCNKGRGMYYPVCGMVHIKELLLLIGKSSPCGGSGFPLSLSEWFFTICLTPYRPNHK